MKDKYKTIVENYRIRLKIKKCTFVVSAANVQTVDEAEGFIEQVSEEFSDAKHNDVYAFKIGLGSDAIERANDAGEPSGSAGPPILQAIKGEGITNIVIVVTRYFGGKHGIGGLIRAYGKCGREVIKEAGVIEKERYLTIGIKVPYDLMGTVINDLGGHHGKIKDTKYTNEGVEIIAVMKPSYLQEFKDRITESTKGEAEFQQLEEEFR
ncbi:IMPACT family protein [Sporohalobacter salinus]|uniref:IMPACT family protein n=1 Tax=Sporohalobacter salinus TaxID=1494606 RepID=UPI0019609303|nr:YigZ family protein [Sporohalobacter salinus]MBM7623232.1 putative YigZ family protein [Sporohalobacter salinus]